MKNDRGIKFLMDDVAEASAHPLDAADQGIEIDEIDRLLRQTADTLSANIDFEAIKQRAVAGAKAKKSAKRRSFRRAVSYALFACASLVLGFTLFSVIGSLKNPGSSGNITAYSSPNVQSESASPSNGVNHRGGSGDQAPIWKMDTGSISENGYRKVTDNVSDYFPDALPESMVKLVDNNESRICAVGASRDGSTISYDFVTSTEPPIELNTGEACSVEDGDSLIYYWQVSEDNCVSVSFVGFAQKQADSMFESLAKRIVQIEIDDGQR